MLAVVPPLVSGLVRLVGATWRYRDVNAPGVRNGHEIPGPSVFAFWHEALLCSAHRFRGLGIAIVISRSFDGELIARVVERLGFVAVRGSSTRGGASVLRQMQQAYMDGRICAFTADGPNGPTQLAALTGAEWVGAFHGHAESAWRLKSWDRFVIPKPWSRITFAWPEHAEPEPEAVQRALDEAVAMAEGAR
jgi:lysophospholipid acyltransferase (LPLAT)-like uncharacterized protein